ncbi:MAG: hypothetical protein AAF253_05245 [Pseudomonadota bacterium]
MRDFRPDLGTVERTAKRLSGHDGGRALMFLASDDGAGTTSAAVSMALRAEAIAARAVWLVDLDLTENSAFKAFQAPPFEEEGALSRPYDASLGKAPIYALSPETRLEAEARGSAKLLCVHQVGARRLLVTRLRTERLEPAQRIRFRDSPDWWPAVRTAADWIIVDAPSLSRSGAGLAVARHMDGVILVLRAGQTAADDGVSLRREVEGAGGRVAGLVLNAMDPMVHRLTAGRLRAGDRASGG